MGTKRYAILTVWGLLGLVLLLLALSADAVASPSGAAGSPGARPQGDFITVCPGGECDYATVQDAVDAASDGDTIKVAAGTYTDVSARPRNDIATTGVVTQVVYISKTVTIRGGYTTTNWESADPEANPTTLDAQGQGRVLYITGNISPTVEGLRITGGDAGGLGGGPTGRDGGGGVYVHAATLTMSNSRLSSSRSEAGGGLCVYSGATVLEGNTFQSNSADGAYNLGGGIYLIDSEARLCDNTIVSNTAHIGGGVYLFVTNGTLERNTIISNTAVMESGGVRLANCDPTLTGNTILSNTSDYGAGLHLFGSNATLNRNNIGGNNATWSGGGVYLQYSDAILTNNAVTDNAATTGGGLSIWGGSPHLLHTTIARNRSGDANGVYVSGGGGVALTNTILVSHTVGITVTQGCTATLEGTLWYGNGQDAGGAGTILTGTVNVYADPAFVDADGDDYHIGPDSAALDQGVATDVMLDIDREPRSYQAPDLGADEYWPPGALKLLYLPLIMRRH